MAWNIEADIEKARQSGYVEGVKIKCSSCNGTGLWPTIDDPESLRHSCKRCKGQKQVAIMSLKQVAFIRVLFENLIQLGAIKKNDNTWHRIVNLMVNHRDGVEYVSTLKASALISQMGKIKNNCIARKKGQNVDQLQIKWEDIR